MGLAKYDEDIREAIDERMRDNGRSYCFSYYPQYQSKRNIANPSYAAPTVTSTAKMITPTFTSAPRRGYIQRNNECNGIEIYFYSKPNEAVRDQLKANYWKWHATKKCWFRRYSSANMRFAEQIIKR